MGLRFDPAGGGQFKEAVKQIAEAEKQPIKAMEARKAREETRLKLFQDFKGKFAGLGKAVDDIASFSNFRELKADLGDAQNLVSVTLDKSKANAGSYEIQVDSLARRTSVISNGFEDPASPDLGLGFIVMNFPNGQNIELYVDEKQASLQGVAALINQQKNIPIQAAVIKDEADADTPYRLMMTAKKDGANNNVDFPEFYFLDGTKDFYVDDTRSSKNAEIIVDGFPVQQSSNDISDFLPGVNLHLKQARPDQPFTLTISDDTAKVTGKVKGMVDEFNKVLKFITDQNTVDEKSDTRANFTGDSGLTNIEYRLRNLFHEGFPVYDNPNDEENYRLVFMNQLGVEFDKGGQLTFKEDKFSKNLETDFAGISEAITGEHGFARQMKTVLQGYSSPQTGLLALRETGLRNRIKAIDVQIENKQRQVDKKIQSVVEQFSRLESSMANMQRQQAQLSATLPGGGGGGNIMSQLLGG